MHYILFNFWTIILSNSYLLKVPITPKNIFTQLNLLIDLGEMSQKFLNLLKTAIFYNFLKIWKIAHFKNTPSQRVIEKGLGVTLFVTSFQAIDRFLGKNYICFALEGFWQSRSGKIPDECVVFGCDNSPSKTVLYHLNQGSTRWSKNPTRLQTSF